MIALQVVQETKMVVEIALGIVLAIIFLAAIPLFFRLWPLVIIGGIIYYVVNYL